MNYGNDTKRYIDYGIQHSSIRPFLDIDSTRG